MKEVSRIDDEEMFSDLEEGCGGTGFLNCFCGGDLCVCDLNGVVECDSCEDCDFDYRDYEDWDEEDEA